MALAECDLNLPPVDISILRVLVRRRAQGHLSSPPNAPEFSMHRPFLALAGLLGATGVATAAAASHGGDTNLGIVANFLLFHAPALIGLGLVPGSRLATI